MQHVMMPETPLARMMWKFVPGGAIREFPCSTSHPQPSVAYNAERPCMMSARDSVVGDGAWPPAFASVGAAAFSDRGQAGDASGARRSQAAPASVGAPALSSMGGCAFSKSGQAGAAASSPASSHTRLAGADAQQIPTSGIPSSTTRKSLSGVLRYESMDDTGRVWGVPNAGGRAQCLDCPKKAAPPSMRCEACQLAQMQGTPMPGTDLSVLRGAFSAALAGMPAKRRFDAETRFSLLYSDLECGKIAQPIQETLLKIARHLSEGSASEAAAEVRCLVAQHWQHHKDWLTGLRCLAAISLTAN